MKILILTLAALFIFSCASTNSRQPQQVGDVGSALGIMKVCGNPDFTKDYTYSLAGASVSKISGITKFVALRVEGDAAKTLYDFFTPTFDNLRDLSTPEREVVIKTNEKSSMRCMKFRDKGKTQYGYNCEMYILKDMTIGQ